MASDMIAEGAAALNIVAEGYSFIAYAEGLGCT
jgi:hypothetical protein